MTDCKNKPAGKWISQIYRRFQIYINGEMKPYDINSSEYIYLLEAGKDEGVNQTYFSEALFIDPALTTRVMKNLEKKGYITRTKDKTDKRCVIIRLTDQGREIQPILQQKLETWGDLLNEGFDSGERERIYNDLVKMSGNVSGIGKGVTHG